MVRGYIQKAEEMRNRSTQQAVTFSRISSRV